MRIATMVAICACVWGGENIKAKAQTPPAAAAQAPQDAVTFPGRKTGDNNDPAKGMAVIGQECSQQQANLILREPCGLALTEAQAADIMKARLILGGRADLKVLSTKMEPSMWWIDVAVGTASGEPVATYRIGRSKGNIDGVRS
jgi:hypothetical protein